MTQQFESLQTEMRRAFLDGAPIVNLGQGLALCGALAQRALHKGQAL